MKEKLKNTAKVWTDPDDAPELDQAFFDKATPYVCLLSTSDSADEQIRIELYRPRHGYQINQQYTYTIVI